MQELYQSFSCFFTYEDCFRALKMNSDDIQAAATWLVEEGNQDCQNTLIAKRKVLLAQSEVINDKINNRNEHDIQVKDDSILYPYDIMDSSWTLNDGQLTLNKYFRNEVATKVFSIYEKDIRVYSSEEDKEEVKEQSITSVTKPMKVSKKKAPPPGRLFGEEDSGESEIDESVASPNLRRDAGIIPVQGNESLNVFDNALKMFERLTLKGAFIKAIKDIKLMDYSMNLSYDHRYNKFYGLVSSQNSKTVLVAQDMTQMRDAVFYYDEDLVKEGISEDKSVINLQKLIQKTIEFFLQFEKIRFDLPWRWRRWSTVFSSANDSSIVKDSKITKRFEKVRDWELNSWRMKFGLQQIAITKKNKLNPKSKQQTSSNPYGQYVFNNDSDQFKEVPVRIEERKMQAYCISGDIKSLSVLFTMIKKIHQKLDNE